VGPIGGARLVFSSKPAYHLGLPFLAWRPAITQGQTVEMPTYFATPATTTSRWHVIDASGRVVGRVATETARLLQGKHKATYTPFLDTGDHVVVINAAQIKLTGRKEDQKLYRRHSGYSGGLREDRAALVRAATPVRLIEHAVRGMLPKSKLGDAMFRKLKVYAGDTHPHAAQQPTTREVV
jgi:large subunit ribosomal protein L13